MKPPISAKGTVLELPLDVNTAEKYTPKSPVYAKAITPSAKLRSDKSL